MAIIDFEVRTITPSDALRLLTTNHQNRVLNKDRVNKYAQDMKAGLWRETGQGLTVYREQEPPGNEYLQDGQTRLYAVVESGVPVRFLVVVVDQPVYDVIDTGQTRSLQQMIGIHFRGQGSQVPLTVTASALAVRDVLVPNGDRAYHNESKAARIHRLAEKIDLYPHAAPLIHEGYLHCGKITGPVGHIAAFLALGEAVGFEETEPFFHRVARGEELRTEMPEYGLRAALIERRYAGGSRGTEVHLAWYEAAVRHWNAYAQGQPAGSVKVQGTIPPLLALSRTVRRAEGETLRHAAEERGIR